MRSHTLVALASAVLAGSAKAQIADGSTAQAPENCRCVPGQPCWPSNEAWAAFNTTVGGNLIKSVPLAQSCYGDSRDVGQCEKAEEMWTNDAFQTAQPLGRYYPLNMTCPPRNANQTAGTCTLGKLPQYAVDATDRQYINATLKFSQDNNLRLTVANTGHDLIGRSDGFGSLAIWVRNLRNDIIFQPNFTSATQCSRSNWTHNAFHINGMYQWGDVNKKAKELNVVVVSGGHATVGANGGWLFGGGHGPATRTYGLGADQLLEAEVMLADGSVVIANHCENADLFKSLRGGGPGYGIVLSTKVKAYPNDKKLRAHKLIMMPKGAPANGTHILDFASGMLQALPSLNEAGYAGYVVWNRGFYYHNLYMMGEGLERANQTYGPVREKLASFQGQLNVINDNFITYGDYWSFYEAELGKGLFPGQTLLMTSRMLDNQSVADPVRVRNTVETVSGPLGEDNLNLILLLSGGKVFEDAADQSSGLHPAWRTCPMVHIAMRNINHTQTLTAAERKAIADDITFTKGKALKQLAPSTGGYMNEGDGGDPEYMTTFYGEANYQIHLAAKKKYDPNHVFYCPTCVGAEQFVEQPDGALCRAPSTGP
ncbi:FAD binding domain-containing protein [Hirsutella rhossiliensis]|uniref:FAD binding domain-containing protein n=1 Tax=Hirsutella rhossiliensis TaxID=111463 RepID=A0A9P8N541_9HYPO|nr:FAD binding domain-containing protein [Hirsutella rhossiliensis]KAH0968633.1 FAD binding domain-containing protein [Hirsutella rhossiliensis]